MYRPPSCAINKFADIIDKVKQFIFSLSSPLPNNIIPDDFNFPGVDWSNPNHPSSSHPLDNLCDSLFISQQVHMPTKKYNILDFIFCPGELINTISISDTFISDHRMDTDETYIPVQWLAPIQLINPPSNNLANLDFHKA